jgi:Fe-S-cluster-containing hydrogenase component 2
VKPIIPARTTSQGIPTKLLNVESKFEVSVGNTQSPCWKCDDSPCIKLTMSASPLKMITKGSHSPDDSICPTKSITRNLNSEFEVDERTCVGCGLCVLACPVNSLALNTSSFPETKFSKLKDVGAEFHKERDVYALLMTRTPNTITSLGVMSAMEVVNKLLNQDKDGKSIRIYVRNIFSNNGFATRIKIDGDTNDSFEVVAEADPVVFPIEIAVGGDTLDSTRRIISGCARIIAKQTVSIERLKPILVVDQMPNSRSEIYRIIEDISNYLKLDIRIIPLNVLQLISLHQIDLQKYLMSDNECSPDEWFWLALKSVGNSSDSDLELLKLTK